MAGEIEVGRAAVRIIADDTQFWASIRRLQAARIGDIKVNADADTAAAQAKIKNLKRESASADDTIKIDVDRRGIAALDAAKSSLGELASGLRSIGTLARVARIPFLLAGLGAIPAIASAATVAVGQLALGLSQGLAGAAGVGGVAVGGLVVGLRAYVGIATNVVSHTMEVYESLKAAVAEEGSFKAVLDQTRPSARDHIRQMWQFGQALEDLQYQLRILRDELSVPILRGFTEILKIAQSRVDDLRPPVMRLAEGVTRVAVSFVKALNEGERFARLRRVLNFVATSGIRAAQIAKNLGLALLAAIQPVLPLASGLQRRLVAISRALRQWAESARGQRQIATFFQNAWRRAQQLWRIVVNLGKGFKNLFQIIAPGTNNIMNGIERLSRSFAKLGAKGTESRKRIQQFVNESKPILRALGNLVGTLVTEFFKLAGNVAKMGSGKRHVNTLAQSINRLAGAVRPVRQLLQQTFKDLGPLIGPLVRQVARFFRVFAGSTDTLTQVVKIMTRLLRAFNKLPEPVKNLVAELVALRIVSKILGLGVLVRLAASAAVAGTKLFRAGRGAKAAGVAARLMGLRILAISWPIALLTAYGDLLFNGGRGHKYLTKQVQESSPALRAFNERLKENRLAQGKSNDALASFINGLGSVLSGKWIGHVAEGVKKMGDAHADAAKKTEDGTARVTSAWAGTQDTLVGHSIIPDMVNKMNQYMGPGVKKGTDAGAHNVGTFKDAVASHLNQTNQQASSWKSSFANIFSSINLSSVGQSIITGLLNGLKSAWGSVQSWLDEKAKSIPDSVKKVLDSHSPSRVMHNIGRDTIQGYLNGMEEVMPRVSQMASRMGALAQPRITAVGATAGMNVRHGDVHATFNTTVNQGASLTQQEAMVHAQVRRHFDRLRRSGSTSTLANSGTA